MYPTSDRRIKPRISCDYPAIIEGIDVDGNKYNDHARLENLSASGLLMFTNRKAEHGSRLSVTIILSNSPEDIDAPKLSTKGTVVRIQSQLNGTCGIAIKFNKYKFL
jgi:hypothetical protein